MRGKDLSDLFESADAGITPRACGEKFFCNSANFASMGSPPRMRGKGVCHIGGVVADRITPAYAGKSHDFFGLVALEGDHPRVCGEKRFSFLSFVVRSGSPPRMRGKVADVALHLIAERITPAYAGKRTEVATNGY